MRQEKVVYVKGEFTNYKGNVQNFIICGITKDMEGSYSSFTDDNFEDVATYKILSVGVSIASELDSYDEDLGKLIAYRKAKSNKAAVMATSFKGFFNQDTVTCILNNTAEVIKKNPSCVIASYAKAEKKYSEAKTYQTLWNKLSAAERTNVQLIAQQTPETIAAAKHLVDSQSN